MEMYRKVSWIRTKGWVGRYHVAHCFGPECIMCGNLSLSKQGWHAAGEDMKMSRWDWVQDTAYRRERTRWRKAIDGRRGPSPAGKRRRVASQQLWTPCGVNAKINVLSTHNTQVGENWHHWHVVWGKIGLLCANRDLHAGFLPNKDILTHLSTKFKCIIFACAPRLLLFSFQKMRSVLRQVYPE